MYTNYAFWRNTEKQKEGNIFIVQFSQLLLRFVFFFFLIGQNTVLKYTVLFPAFLHNILKLLCYYKSLEFLSELYFTE